MPRFLIIKLDGVMQGWGGHTYEDWRPSELFPTRSGLLGLLGACIGIERQDKEQLDALAASILFTVRTNCRAKQDEKSIDSLRLCDYHTIQYARKVDGSENKNPVQSYRWYLYDSLFTVLIEELPDALYTLDLITDKLRKPIFTPSLGRRSCPLSRPLLDKDTKLFEAHTVMNALEQCGSTGDVIYSESPAFLSEQKIRIRDVPIYGRIRRFTTRNISIHVAKEVQNVSQ
jgi:CRISPR system Cascade subunit CasD